MNNEPLTLLELLRRNARQYQVGRALQQNYDLPEFYRLTGLGQAMGAMHLFEFDEGAGAMWTPLSLDEWMAQNEEEPVVQAVRRESRSISSGVKE